MATKQETFQAAAGNVIKYSGPLIKEVGFNPKPVAGKIPLFADSIANPKCYGTRLHKEWWEEQFYFMEFGYKTGGFFIPGIYYQYLNYQIIAGLGGNVYPDFTDTHYRLYRVVDEMKKHHIPGIVIPKGRRLGISLFGTSLANNGMRFIDGYRMGVAGGLEGYVRGFRNKLYASYNDCAPEMQVGHLLKNKDEFKLGWEEESDVGMVEIVTSLSSFKTMKDDATKLEGEYFHDVIAEEAGNFKNVEEFLTSIRPTMDVGAYTLGTIYIYGCVCAGTKVWDNYGNLLNIEDLKPENGILGFDGKGISKENITYWQPPKNKPCYRITTFSGRALECSEDHPILWSRKDYHRGPHSNKSKATKFVETKDIKVGDQIAVIDSVQLFGNKEMWEPRLIGWLIGDGTYGIDHSPRLSNCDKEINFIVENNYDAKVVKSHTTKDGKNYKEIRIKGICHQLRTLGIYGQTKNKKTLPIDIHSYSKNDICELLGGLFDTDGHINEYGKNLETITLTSSSYNLLFEIKLLLQKLGIHCNISKIIPNLTKISKSRNDYYKINISDKRSIIAFYEQITFKIEYKQDKLVRIKNQMLIRNNKAKKEIEGLRFERVASIEYIGTQPVYNLTAGKTNTYIANGIITHNTGGDTMRDSKGFKNIWHQTESLGFIQYPILSNEYHFPYYVGAKDKAGNIPEEAKAVTDKLLAQGYEPEQILGCEDHDAAEKHIREVRAILAKNPDKSMLVEWNQKYPLSVEEIFTSSGSNNFNNDLLYGQAYNLETSVDDIQKVVLEWKRDEHGVIIMPLEVTIRPATDKDRDWMIVDMLRPPNPNMKDLDIGGIDGYNEDVSTTSNSLGAMNVVRRYDEFPDPEELKKLNPLQGRAIICQYYKRPPRKEMFFEICLMISVAYNLLHNTMVSAEADLVIQYFKNQSCVKYLSPRPKSFDAPSGELLNDFGAKMTMYSKPRMVGLLQSWVEDNIEWCRYIRTINDLISYDDANIGTDYDSADALGLCLMRIEDMKRKPKHHENDEDYKNLQLPSYTKGQYGISEIHDDYQKMIKELFIGG